MNLRERSRPKILVICDYYLPGFKSGGGMRTIVNTVARLSDQFEFFVVTRNHDGRGDLEPYGGVRYGEWNEMYGAKVYYLGKDEVRSSVLEMLIGEVRPSCIYLNSVFSTLTLLTLRLRRGRRFPTTVLAPCGELSAGALRTRRLRKWVYCRFLRLTGHFDAIRWKASNREEACEVRSMAGLQATVTELADMPAKFEPGASAGRSEKTKGTARFVFLSRISPKKNLTFLIEKVKRLGAGATLDVYGDVDDAKYLESCTATARGMSNVAFRGALPHEEVLTTLSNYDFFVLPTFGENFGHVVLESLVAGRPVVISDMTPWNRLSVQGAGFVIPLEDELWDAGLESCVSMDGAEHRRMVEAARTAAMEFLGDPSLEAETRLFLEAACSSSEVVP